MRMRTLERDIGEFVRERRRELGLSIDALAYRAGISPRVLVLLERYGIPPRTRRTREKLCEALGLAYDELFGMEPQEVSVP